MSISGYFGRCAMRKSLEVAGFLTGVKLCFKLFSQPIMEGVKCRNFCDFLLQILIFLPKFFRAKKGAKGHFARKISKQSLIKK